MSRTTTTRWLYLAATLTTFLGVTMAANVANPWNKKHYVKRNTRQQSPLICDDCVTAARQQKWTYHFLKNLHLLKWETYISNKRIPTDVNQIDIRSMLPSQWQIYAPNPPSPEEVDCHIELEVVEQIGGRCVRLGGYGNEEGPAVCQSGIHLDIWNNECEHVMAARQNTQQTAQSGHETSTADTGKR